MRLGGIFRLFMVKIGHESRGHSRVILPRYVGGIPRRSYVRHPFRDVYIHIYIRTYSKKKELPRFWILCHSLRWPYITAPLSQRAVSFYVASSFIQNAKSMSVIFGADRRLPAAVRTYNGSYAKISRIRARASMLPSDVSNTSAIMF